MIFNQFLSQGQTFKTAIMFYDLLGLLQGKSDLLQKYKKICIDL